jgi:hypothetical protein
VRKVFLDVFAGFGLKRMGTENCNFFTLTSRSFGTETLLIATLWFNKEEENALRTGPIRVKTGDEPEQSDFLPANESSQFSFHCLNLNCSSFSINSLALEH